MNQFYVSLIFLGIILIIFTFVWIAYDSKKSHDYTRKLDEKKDELISIISDAEQMVEELNKFSDYIVNQMDIKNQEMYTSLKSIEQRIAHINDIANEIEKTEHTRASVDGNECSEKNTNTVTLDFKYDSSVSSFSNDLVLDNMELDGRSIVYARKQSQNSRANHKVIPLNSKHNEVVQLAAKGWNDTEIAKKLNVGKGEVQLILGMSKQAVDI